MSRMSLTAALAELRNARKRRARHRVNVVAGDWASRTDPIRQIDRYGVEVDEEIRQTKALVARLQIVSRSSHAR
jgi:hypothetical protein